jgi:hypothetical protein
MFGTRSATQKFPKFRSRARTGFSMDQLRLVELNVSFVNQRATWLHAECTHSFNLRVFGGVCAFCDFFFRRNGGREGAACLHSFISNLAGVRQKLKKCLNKHLVIMLWLRRKSTTGITSLKIAERQLTTNVLDLQSA